MAALLTPRETGMIRMVAQGLRNREIADKLCISEGTVKVNKPFRPISKDIEKCIPWSMVFPQLRDYIAAKFGRNDCERI